MNQKIDKEKKSNKEKRSEFEFCKVCNLNHDQGRSHKYYPNHKKPLFDFLSRFQSKLDGIRFFVKNPSLLSPDHASLNRFWCVFCDTDIDDIGSSFACAHAIHHLQSADHLKNLKHFLWKYGGGMDCLDTFRILEADVAKCYTNEYQISNSGLSADANVGQFVLDAVSSLSADALTGRGLWNSNDLTVHWKSQQLLPCRSVPSSCNLS